MKLLMITGWGLGTEVLNPFVSLLQQHHQVDVWDIFDPFDPTVLPEKITAAQDYDVLMGWSLGGQLAIYLAHQLQHIGLAKPVIAYMSNPCFVANADWQSAMPATQFEQFYQAVQQDIDATLKRFTHLVCMGSSDSRSRAKSLQNQLHTIDLNHQKSHLHLLKQLNLVPILKTYSEKMLFIFSSSDALVPYHISSESVFYQQSLIQVEKINAAHDAILFDSKLLIAPIQKFLCS